MKYDVLHITMSRWELTVLRTFILHIAHICKKKSERQFIQLKYMQLKVIRRMILTDIIAI